MAGTYFGLSYFGRDYFGSSYFGRITQFYTSSVLVQSTSLTSVSAKRNASIAIAIQSAGTQTVSQKRIAKGLPSLVDVLSILDSHASRIAKTNVPLSSLTSLSATSIVNAKGNVSVSSLTSTLQNAKRVAVSDA